jgi:VRR-NUC domain
MRESAIEKYLVERVQNNGGACLKLANISHRGFPDRTIIWTRAHLPPVIHFVEVKTATGKIALWQRRWMKDLRAMGCPCYVIRSEDEVDEYVKAFRPPLA